MRQYPSGEVPSNLGGYMKPLYALSTLVLFTLAAPARAAESAIKAPGKITASMATCSKAGYRRVVQRTIEIKPHTGGGCRVYYTRDNGKPEEVGHADHQLEVCPEVKERIIQRLEDEGFTCIGQLFLPEGLLYHGDPIADL